MKMYIPIDGTLHNIPLTYDVLSQLTCNQVWLLMLLMVQGLIRSVPPICPLHQSNMRLSTNKKISDQFEWTCKKVVDNKRCHKTKSIRVNSFFEGSRLCLRQIVLLLWQWS